MKHRHDLALLPLLFTLLAPACDRDGPSEARVNAGTIVVRVPPLEALSLETDTCDAEPPLLAEFDPGPVELPGPSQLPARSRKMQQCG